MSTRYVSADGHWRVTAIVLNGAQLLRVEHSSPVANGRVALHWDAFDRIGPHRTGANWYLIRDCRSVAEVARYVPLAELEVA